MTTDQARSDQTASMSFVKEQFVYLFTTGGTCREEVTFTSASEQCAKRHFKRTDSVCRRQGSGWLLSYSSTKIGEPGFLPIVL